MGFFSDRGCSLEEAKYVCLIEIDQWLGGKTLDTFDSSVLGPQHRYCCAESDQLRFINGKVANTVIDLMCGPVLSPDTDPIYAFKAHTSSECGKLQAEYVLFIKAASLAAKNFRDQVFAAATIAEVDTIFEAMNALVL